MKTNPEKIQAKAVGQQTYNENITFNLENNVITCEESMKLLGVTIDFKLNFDKHVSNICKKGIKAIKCPKKNWEAFVQNILDIYILNIYYSFILSNFNYCLLTWHFCGEVNTKENEKIQEGALRFIYSDYNSSYESLLV